MLTREAHGIRPAGRLTAAELLPLWDPAQTAYVCGSAAFAESASRLLVDLGFPGATSGWSGSGPAGPRPDSGRNPVATGAVRRRYPSR